MASSEDDYYSILNVDSKASDEIIRSAYRKLARKWHPDVNPSEKARENFDILSEAYQVLSDPKKRKQYDTLLAFSFGLPLKKIKDKYINPANIQMVMKKVATGLAVAAGLIKKKKSQKGRDLRIKTEISFFESYTGTASRIEYGQPITCTQCKGTGFSEIEPCLACSGAGKLESKGFMGLSKRCPKCDGLGWRPVTKCENCIGMGKVIKEQNMKIKIPAGVNDKQRLRIKAMGEAGEGLVQESRFGDLIVVVNISKHENFSRSGNDIHGVLPTPLKTAALGGGVIVDMPHGQMSVQTPPSTWDGRLLRIIGAGFPDTSQSSRGDGFFKVDILVPEKEDEKELHSRYIETVHGPGIEVSQELTKEIERVLKP